MTLAPSTVYDESLIDQITATAYPPDDCPIWRAMAAEYGDPLSDEHGEDRNEGEES